MDLTLALCLGMAVGILVACVPRAVIARLAALALLGVVIWQVTVHFEAWEGLAFGITTVAASWGTTWARNRRRRSRGHAHYPFEATPDGIDSRESDSGRA
ncbi:MULTISPECIES: hypothetical protein [unclassified Agrococcus]|uniref:hypothetical protein n=1 Tax=unclassified Agrococcus TaxID=2615065 RepID=UPI00360783DB